MNITVLVGIWNDQYLSCLKSLVVKNIIINKEQVTTFEHFISYF